MLHDRKAEENLRRFFNVPSPQHRLTSNLITQDRVRPQHLVAASSVEDAL